jgi:hypothetical protein
VTADVSNIRKSVRAVLTGSAPLTAALGAGDRIFYGQVRQAAVFPSVVLNDTGTRPDVTVPLHVRTFTIDIFANSFEQAESIAAIIKGLLDNQPLTATGWKINIFKFSAEREAPFEEGDIVNRTLEFSYSAYDIT